MFFMQPAIGESDAASATQPRNRLRTCAWRSPPNLYQSKTEAPTHVNLCANRIADRKCQMKPPPGSQTTRNPPCLSSVVRPRKQDRGGPVPLNHSHIRRLRINFCTRLSRSTSKNAPPLALVTTAPRTRTGNDKCQESHPLGLMHFAISAHWWRRWVRSCIQCRPYLCPGPTMHPFAVIVPFPCHSRAPTTQLLQLYLLSTVIYSCTIKTPSRSTCSLPFSLVHGLFFLLLDPSPSLP